MQITKEQLDAVRSGQSVRLTENGTDVVVLRADIFDRLQSLLADDTVCTTAEMVDRVMAEDDANDPQLAELQRYSFAQLMAGVTTKNIHDEVSTQPAVGGEAL